MNILLDLYLDYKPTMWGFEMKATLAVVISSILFFLIASFAPAWLLKVLTVILLASIALMYFSGIYNSFRTRQHTHGEPGRLLVGPSGIEWNRRKVFWLDVASFSMLTSQPKGKRDWKEANGGHKYDGFNAVTLKLKSGEILEGHYKLTPPELQELIHEVLWACILSNQLDYEVAKSMLQLNNYAEHQALRKKLAELRGDVG